MKKLLVLFTLLIFSSFGFSQIDMSKIAIDGGFHHSGNSTGIKLGATYFLTNETEVFSSYVFRNFVNRPSYEFLSYDVNFGIRHLLRQRNRLTTHIGLEAGYQHQKVNFGSESSFDRSLYVTVPILWRYQVTDRFSLEADLGLGISKSLEKQFDYSQLQMNAGIGFKYRLGKNKK